ncbi:MAG: hypothetical protein KY469_20515 [Actinobacteria bacterium]|nr:hypothetical protein [Actinomycetota bacterium]
MTTSITIRNVPEDAHNELSARARRSGRSLQEYLRSELIELARQPDPADLMERVRQRKQQTGSRLSADRIVEHRAADRR